MSDFRIAIDDLGQKHKIYEVITSMRALGWEWFTLKKPGKGSGRFGFVQSPIVPEGEFGSFDITDIPSPTIEKQSSKATALPPEGWKWESKKNPVAEGDIWNDTVRVLEHKFRKPYSRFNDQEHQFLDRLFRKASDNRISLKIYPANHNPKRKKKRRSVGVQDDKKLSLNPPSVVKTKADETKWRRAVRSAERKFKKKEKDFKERQWRYTMGTFKRMKNI